MGRREEEGEVVGEKEEEEKDEVVEPERRTEGEVEAVCWSGGPEKPIC